MGEFDPAFIQPIERRPKLSPTNADDLEIPVIDLSPITGAWDSLSGSTQADDVVSKIGEACKNWGFFQVINHGVPLDKLERVESKAKEFFSLPFDEKRKVRRTKDQPLGYYEAENTKNVRDWKEVFDYVWHPTVLPASLDDLEAKPFVERWPDRPSDFRFRIHSCIDTAMANDSCLVRIVVELFSVYVGREICQDYGKEVEKLAYKLMELIALSLGLRADRFLSFFEDDTTFIRLNHYPACPSPELALGVGNHKDSGALTVLAQDGVGGLEVRRKSDGEWIPVKPVPDAYIINVGDIIQVWSNDRYESVEHRVVVNTEKDRISIPLFINPGHYVTVKPLEELVDDQNPPKFKEYNWGAFFAARLGGNLKKLEVENLQIEHFRI